MYQNDENDNGFNIYDATQRGSRRDRPGMNNDGPAKRTRTQMSKKKQRDAADEQHDGQKKNYGANAGIGGFNESEPVPSDVIAPNRTHDRPAGQGGAQYGGNVGDGNHNPSEDDGDVEDGGTLDERNTIGLSRELAHKYGIGMSPWAEDVEYPVKQESTMDDRDNTPEGGKVKIQEPEGEPPTSGFSGFGRYALSMTEPLNEIGGMPDDGSEDGSALYTNVNIAEELMNHLQIRMSSHYTKIRASEVSGLDLGESFDRFLGASRYLPLKRQEDLVATVAEFANILADVNENAHPTANTIIFEKFYSALVRTTSRERKAVLLEKWFNQLAQTNESMGQPGGGNGPADDKGQYTTPTPPAAEEKGQNTGPEATAAPIKPIPVLDAASGDILEASTAGRRFKYILDKVIESHILKRRDGPTIIDKDGVVFERVANDYLSTEYEVLPGSTYQIRLRHGYNHNNPPLTRLPVLRPVVEPDVPAQQSYTTRADVSSASRAGTTNDTGDPSDSSSSETDSSGGGYQRGSTPYLTRPRMNKKKKAKSDDEGLERRNKIRTEQSRSMVDGDYLRSIRKVLMSRLLRRYKEYTATERDAVKGSRAPKVEVPKIKYSGEREFSVLEDWVLEQSTYFSAAHLTGPDAETDRMLHIKSALDGEAYRWYRTQVIGYSASQNKTWTVERIIRELFRRFIDIGKLHDLKDAFNAFRWLNSYEVDTYYNELMMIVEIMPIMPSENEIVQKFRSGLPAKITDKMIDGFGVNMTTEPLRSLRRSAVIAEDMIRQKKSARQQAERERIVAETYAEAIKKLEEKDVRPMAARVPKTRDTPRGADGRFISRREADDRREDSGKNRERPIRDEKRAPSVPRPKRLDGAGEKTSRTPVCFDCGAERERMGHAGCRDPGSGKFRPKPRERMQAMHDSDADNESDDSDRSNRSQRSVGARTVFDVSTGDVVGSGDDQETSDDGEYAGEFIRAIHADLDLYDDDICSVTEMSIDYEAELEGIATTVAWWVLDDGAEESEMDDGDCPNEHVYAMTAIRDDERQVLEVTRPGRKGRRTVALDLSSRIIERPVVRPLERMCLVTYTSVVSSVKDCLALTLWDSGSTIQGVSHVFTELAKLRVYQLKDAIPLYLGTIGSRSLIKYGTFAETRFGDRLIESYWDLVNLDRYDMLIGVPFMLRNGVVLDFEHRCVRIGSLTIPGEVVPVNQAVQMRAHMRQKEEISRRRKDRSNKVDDVLSIVDS